MTFLYHGPLTFVVREPLLPLSLQNILDHDNGYCDPKIGLLGP